MAFDSGNATTRLGVLHIMYLSNISLWESFRTAFAGNGENARLRALPIAIGSAARHKLWHRSWTPPTLALLAAAAARSQWKTARIALQKSVLGTYEG